MDYDNLLIYTTTTSSSSTNMTQNLAMLGINTSGDFIVKYFSQEVDIEHLLTSVGSSYASLAQGIRLEQSGYCTTVCLCEATHNVYVNDNMLFEDEIPMEQRKTRRNPIFPHLNGDVYIIKADDTGLTLRSIGTLCEALVNTPTCKSPWDIV